MGKNVQGEYFLRRAEKSEKMSAVSETMTTSSMTLKTIESQAQGEGFTHITSPVMKKLSAAASSSLPVANPTVPEVEAAYSEVELDMSSNSSKKEKKRAEAQSRYDQQSAFSKKAAVTVTPFGVNDVKEELHKLNVNSLMHQESGETGYERFLAKYNEIKTALGHIDEYKAYVQNRLDNELPGLQQGAPAIKEIREEQAKLKTLYDIRAYYDVLEDMLKNKYYALLPQDRMEKLSYHELRRRLNKLYEANDPSKEELIKYYQNLVRLRELDLSKEGNAEDREKLYERELDTTPETKEDKRDPVKVMKNMAELFKKLEEYTGSEKHLCDSGTCDMYRKKFLETHLADYNKFKNKPKVDLTKSPLDKLDTAFKAYLQPGGNTPQEDHLHSILQAKKPEFDDAITRKTESSEGIELKQEQRDSINEIGAFIMEKGIKDKKIPFVNNLLQAPPDQQLLIFYLIECNMQPVALDASFFVALNDYKPNIERFKYFASFENMSKAMRRSIQMRPQLIEYGRLQKKIKDADADVEYDKDKTDPKQKNRSFDDKKQAVVKALVNRGKLLKMLYKNAGLHEGMPPDMASNLVMRKRIMDEFKEMGNLCGRLSQIVKEEKDANPQAAATDPEINYESKRLRQDRPVLKETSDDDHFDQANEDMGRINEYLADDGLGIIDDLTVALTRGDPGFLNVLSFGVTGLAGVLGAIGVVMGGISYSREFNGMTAADAWAQGIGLGGSVLGVTGTLLSSASALTDVIGNTVKLFEVGTEVGDELIKHAGDMSVAAGVFAVGAGAVQMGVSAVQLTRSIAANYDVERSEKALAQTLAQKKAKGQEITADEERLGRFLTHQKLENHIQEGSAVMGGVNGFLAATAGGLMMGVATAPFGALVGLLAIGSSIITKVSCWGVRKHNKTLTVDAYLHLDDAVQEVLKKHKDQRIKDKKADDIKDMVREEMLAMMGFSSKDDCFRFICEQMAETLYLKGVEDQNPEKMYEDAVASLNMHVDRAKHKPSYDAILTKLMSQGG